METVTTLFSSNPQPPHSSRHGQTWQASDYELLVRAVRDGLDVDVIADRVGRSANSIAQRLRRLLPLPQRDCLPELVLPTLRAALADESYDWAAEMLLSPPPTPIIRNEITRTGIAGLDDDQLIRVGYALIASAGYPEADLLAAVTGELEKRDLLTKLVALRAERSVRCSPGPIGEDEAWAAALYWVHGPNSSTYWRRRVSDVSAW